MRPNFITLLATAFLFISITACQKESTSKSSNTGLSGANGTKIYSGNTDPATTLGTTGDYYINLTTDMLFGPKAASGWGTGVALADATFNTNPDNVATGGQLYNGSGAPSATLGTTGDFYLDTTAYLLYGPKTSSGWGVPIAVQAPGTNPDVKTDVFSVGGSQWVWNSQYIYETTTGSYTEYFTRYYTRANNTVTQNVLTNGMVLCYMQPSPLNNPYQWAPLPYQFDSSFGYTFNYVYVTAPGQVTLMYFFIQTDASATLPTLSTYSDETREYKIVTVTGQTGVFMATHHIDLNNYNEVSRVTGLWQQDKAGR